MCLLSQADGYLSLPRSWSAPDSMQTLYKRVCEYMELDDRVEVLNNRFQVGAHCLHLPVSQVIEQLFM